MEPDVTKIIDNHFPKTVAGQVTMQQVAEMRDEIRHRLTGDYVVELTLLMQTLCLSVWKRDAVDPSKATWSRQCEVVS